MIKIDQRQLNQADVPCPLSSGRLEHVHARSEETLSGR